MGVPGRRGIMRAATKAGWEAVAVEVGSAVTIPLLGTVAAGLPFQAFPVEGTLELPAGLWGGRTVFALRARGSSMIDDGIRDGDYLIVQPRARGTAARGFVSSRAICARCATATSRRRRRACARRSCARRASSSAGSAGSAPNAADAGARDRLDCPEPLRFPRAVSRLASSGRSPLVVLFLTVFIDLMGFGIVIPLLPIYAKQMNATRFTAGALISVYSLMQLVFAPAWGRISDDIGRRPVLLMCLAGSAMSYLLLAAAWRLEVLFLARVLAGVAGASIPVAQAYIADVTGPAERARGMGLIGVAFGLGMVIGPALGGGLSLLGPRVPEGFAAGLCLANVLVAAYRLPESLPGSVRRPKPFRHPLSLASLRDAVVWPGRPPCWPSSSS